MKIVTNNIGNYGINKIPQTVKKPIVESKNNTVGTVTESEKSFFMKLYPAQKEEIINYHFYGKRGELNGVAVGKNIDTRM